MRTATARPRADIAQLDGGYRDLALRSAQFNSLLFPASAGREFAVDRTNSSAISDAYLTSLTAQKTVFG
jgi:hypothetical protein